MDKASWDTFAVPHVRPTCTWMPQTWAKMEMLRGPTCYLPVFRRKTEHFKTQEVSSHVLLRSETWYHKDLLFEIGEGIAYLTLNRPLLSWKTEMKRAKTACWVDQCWRSYSLIHYQNNVLSFAQLDSFDAWSPLEMSVFASSSSIRPTIQFWEARCEQCAERLNGPSATGCHLWVASTWHPRSLMTVQLVKSCESFAATLFVVILLEKPEINVFLVSVYGLRTLFLSLAVLAYEFFRSLSKCFEIVLRLKSFGSSQESLRDCTRDDKRRSDLLSFFPWAD